ncbi:MAG: PRC-barrel domain-containing protein [Candidatus Berkelbacteria bacterium]|nr:PRC-barrel domain-containing protein [Candidatus Berkelbacteria bacterium]
MLVQASAIINRPVFTQNENKEIGNVLEIVIDPEKGLMAGFLISQIFQKPKFVFELDVLDLTKRGLLITSEKAAILPSENENAVKILKKHNKIIKSKAVTESRKILGVVEDYILDTDTTSIVKYYVRGGLFSPSRILSAEQVIRIEKNRIVFSDQMIEKSKATEAAAV